VREEGERKGKEKGKERETKRKIHSGDIGETYKRRRKETEWNRQRGTDRENKRDRGVSQREETEVERIGEETEVERIGEETEGKTEAKRQRGERDIGGETY
jgi:hypothetical protein